MKGISYFRVLLLLSVTLLIQPLFGQNREEVDSLKKDVSKIKEVLSKLPKVSGYVQTGYFWSDENAGDKSSFQLKRMRLFLYKEISKTFEFKTQLECFSGSTDGTPYKKKVITIMDAFVNARLDKAINFRIGQFYLPIGFENFDISPATLETVDFSNICYRMVCRNAVSTPNKIDYGRDIGVMAYGDLFKNEKENFSHLSYQFAVTNGQLPTLTDNNKSKDIVARLTFRPIKNLRILGSYNWGEYEMNTTGNTDKYTPMNRFTVGAWYLDPRGLDLRAEYGHVESDEANVDEDGLYILASYNFDKFSPVVRYDSYRDNVNKTTANNRDVYLAGLSYKVSEKFKLQLNYLHYVYTDDVAKDGDGNGLQAMCILKF